MIQSQQHLKVGNIVLSCSEIPSDSYCVDVCAADHHREHEAAQSIPGRVARLTNNRCPVGAMHSGERCPTYSHSVNLCVLSGEPCAYHHGDRRGARSNFIG
ncbi:MAG TPA: hypothetical protein DCG12_14510 [Planctomycetaceae bacterium]|nr:hypothetical protein [Planctomycetaceae bacterium]